MASPIRIAVIGTGWRARFYIRLALAMPQKFELVGIVVRRAESVELLSKEFPIPVFTSITELVSKTKPEYVVSSVTWAANSEVVKALVELNIAVLSETPPAPDVDGLRALWSAVGSSKLVQVAEQYLLLPGHAARITATENGEIGTVTSVQVSSTHGYHAVSMMRGFLGRPFGSATVRTSTFVAPLVDPLIRDAWNPDQEEKQATTTIATIDFGDGRSGLYDFTDNQWHNQLRARRIVIRGSQGEISNDELIRLTSPTSIVKSQFNRYQVGQDLNLDGHDTEHISLNGKVIWRNPYFGMRLMDEEIAVASMMEATANWVRDSGPEPYPLADASQDHLLSLAIDESAKSGKSITTEKEAWGA
jgi:predicted dehydrogenase